MESEIKWLSQDIDYVGFLREKLAGLSGFLTMAKELVQNADDEKAKFINFDFYPEKLTVKNPSRFSEIDFQRMQNIASGGKRLESGKTGTFGVGFISVYQVTDHPELLSSGRHWVFHPENTSNERIQETPCDIAEHTEFHLPWAFEVKSDVRLRLGRNALTLENVRNFLEELYSSLPQMLLFLRTLNRIEILNEGKTVASSVREIFKKDGYEEVWINTQRYKGTNSTQCWIVFRRPFDVPPIDLAGANKENEVAIAFPSAIEGNDKFGLLYNYLPTPISTAFNFHINGDFFPTPDRRNIVLEGPGYETEWNSYVIGQIALLFVDNFANLNKIIGFEDFYAILPQLEYKSPSIKELEQIKDMFLKKARNSKIIYSSTGDWHTPEETFFLDGEHNRLIPLLGEAGLKLVNPSLRQYRNLFTYLGVSVWGIKDLIELVSKQNIEPGCILSDVPLFLSSIEKLNTLLSFIDLELSRQKGPTRQGIIDELKSMPLGLCGDEKLYPFNSIYYADETVQKAFSRFDHRPKFGHSIMRKRYDNFLRELEPKFSVSDAISYCGKLSKNEVLELYVENILPQIWDYLATDSSEITRSNSLMSQFRSLKIFLTKQKEQFSNLENLSLPGNYSDPIGLDIIIDTSILSGKVLDLLKKADLRELDFRRYFLEHIPRFLESEEKVGDHETKFRIAKEVKQHFSEIDSPEVRKLLGDLPIILCNDNSYHCPGEVYLHSEELDMVFDGEYLQPANCYYGEGKQGWNEWFKTIGVNTSPRGEDVEKSIRELITTLNNENISKIEQLFYYLGERFAKLPEEEQAKYQFLKSVEWLPAEGKEDRYYLPSEVYAPFNKHLFSSQALFIPFRQMRYMRTEFLNFIEIGNLKVSEVDKVARHLLWLSEEGEDPQPDMYRYLRDNLDGISEETLLALKRKPVIFVHNEGYVEPKKLFWSDHPFGSYRFKLSESLRPYYSLFSSLGSKELPEYIDYVEVLLEISALFGKENRILDDVSQKVVKQIYSYLALECPIDSGELKRQFCEKKVVLDARKRGRWFQNDLNIFLYL